MFTISALWTRRSTKVTTVVALGKASLHCANSLFEVMRMDLSV